MRGRKPKPTEVKKLAGNPGNRPLNAREPQMPSGGEAFDAVPLELHHDLVASSEWERLAPMLRKARVATEADRASLMALCQQWSRYLEANGSVAKAGMVVRSPSGYPMPNPYIAISNKALTICVKLWTELGLTPSSRSRVIAGDDESSADPFAEFDKAPDRHVN